MFDACSEVLGEGEAADLVALPPVELGDALGGNAPRLLALDERADGAIGNPEGWLFRIAHNEAYSLLRRRRPEGELPPEQGGVGPPGGLGKGTYGFQWPQGQKEDDQGIRYGNLGKNRHIGS